RTVIVEREDLSLRARLWSEVIGEDINSLQCRNLVAAINVTPNHGLSCRMRIIKNGINTARGPRTTDTARRRRNFSFAESPLVIFAAAGIRRLLYINFLARVLPDIADKHSAGLSIETVPKRIPQSECPNFLTLRRRPKERVVRRNGRCARGWRDMNAKYLAEQRRVVLRVAARFDVAGALIVRITSVTCSNVKIVIVARARAKPNPAAVVIGFGMIK